MFDLVGLATTDGTPLRNSRSLDGAFTREPWGGRKHIRRRIDAPDCRAAGLTRGADSEDCVGANGCQLFLVGDAFPRISNAGTRGGRISAGNLLKAYHDRGLSLVDAIKGNFSILILDRPKQRFCILSSHFGVSPLFYAYVDGAVYFSTSLAELGCLLPQQPRLDHAAIVEMMVFNWPFQERTFLEGVRRMSPGTIVIFSGNTIDRQRYWDQRPLHHLPLLRRSDALDQGSELFHDCVNALVCDREKICASFTSGFDSRALHAVLELDHSQILSYSFGISGSVNVSIPKAMSKQLGYSFQPFYLDKKFEEEFDVYARHTVILSDGFVVQRANYAYVFEQLSSFAPVVVTGIFGSEFLRTFQSVGEFVSGNFARLNRAQDPVSEARAILREQTAGSYLLPEVYTATQEEVEADIENWFDWSRGFDTNQRLHLYLLGEASRRYFGGEVSTERIYATNLFPYLDLDFFEFIARAPFVGMHSRAIKPSVSDRFSSQHFYAYLIRKYRPELLRYTTDHGYPPADLLKSPSLLYTGPKFLWSNLKGRVTRYREFKPHEWLSGFYSRHLFSRSTNGLQLVSPRFEQDFRSGAWHDDLRTFDKIAALRLWLEEWY